MNSIDSDHRTSRLLERGLSTTRIMFWSFVPCRSKFVKSTKAYFSFIGWNSNSHVVRFFMRLKGNWIRLFYENDRTQTSWRHTSSIIIDGFFLIHLNSFTSYSSDAARILVWTRPTNNKGRCTDDQRSKKDRFTRFLGRYSYGFRTGFKRAG